MRLGILGSMFVGFALLACNPITGNIKGSGNVVTNSMDISGFNKIDAGHTFQVTITQSEDYSVVINSDDNLVEHLDVRLDGDTLIINLTNRKSVWNATLEAEVSLPELTAVGFHGASHGNLHGIASDSDFTASVSGAKWKSGCPGQAVLTWMGLARR